jgi:hypothetical protein
MSKPDSVQRLENRFHHGVRTRHNIVVPEAQNFEPLPGEKGIASRVIRRRVGVLAAIDLDD